uniref:Multiple epidermal growth factor-like domains 6 n=1 Tax=Magallana gigas TaxID=29159 RepID=A0A8W8JGW4_MAGGI
MNAIQMANIEQQALFSIFMTSYTFALRCEGFYKGCCPGSSWNSTSQQCERCTPGYSGVNCSFPCPYPSYGVECQQSCNCIQDLCDVSTGCMNSNKGCMPGYSGVNCSLQCPYPSYGVNCQKICNCIQELCDVSKGCQQTTTAHTICISGYFGRYCRARCIYPYYGEECEAQCNCSESMCDVTIGCKAVDEGMIQMSTKKVFL